MGLVASARRRVWQPGLLLALALATTVLPGPVAWAQQGSPVAVTKKIIGLLLVTRVGGTLLRFQEGQPAQDLFEEDRLRTGEKAQAIIEFKDGTQVALNEKTEFVILSRQPRGGGGLIRIIDLLLGELWIRTREGPVPLEVTTPVATAAIRSTEFNINIVAPDEVRLVVVEGIVEFGTPFGTCPIRTRTFSVGVRGKRCTRPDPNVDIAQAIAWTATLLQPPPGPPRP